MPITTGKGYKIPQNGERGSWWQNIIDNFLRIDSHKHDGLDSQLIDARNISKFTQDILAVNWLADADGLYKQEVTLSPTMDFTKLCPTFLIVSGDDEGAVIHPTIKKSASNKYEIFVNDDSLTLKVIYA